MKINKLKTITVVGAIGLAMGLGAIAQAAVYIQPAPRCNYYPGYMVCYGPGGASNRYYAYKKIRICTRQGLCHYKYCYKTPYQPPYCQDYYPNRLY